MKLFSKCCYSEAAKVITQFSANAFFYSEIIKNHTCEEGGAHLRISVWDLLITLKKQIFI